jgi:hypothetical protein
MCIRPAPRWLPILALCALATAAPRPARAAILHVPAQHPTVRAAVDSAASGDTVLVAPGIHPGGVHIKGKAVTLASWFLLTGDTSFVSQTVIDSVVGVPCPLGGCAGDAILEFAGSAGGSAVVGLTLQHGEDGVRAYSRVDVAFCRVIGNADGLDYQSGSSGTIRHSLFAWNTDDGVDVNGRTSVRVLNNVIRDNHQDGVEFRLYPYAGPELAVEFIGNRILDNGGDGIQLIDYPDTSSRVIRIEHNLFRRNLDAAVGCMPDGLTSEDFSGAPIAERVHLLNNTFRDGNYGFVGGANVIALNNVFTGFEASALRRMGGNSIASYCVFWDNGTHYEDSNVDPPNNRHADPDFEGDCAPDDDSPLVDGGTDHFVWRGETVLDLPPGAYAGSAPDIGAWEYGLGFPDGNAAPLVEAGPDRLITLPGEAVLNAAVSDDWMPLPPALGATWSAAGGPGPVRFEDAHAFDTRASFLVPGTYVLRLSVTDGALTTTDSVRITVDAGPAPGALVVERRIAADSDDQEENAGGSISPNVSDIELVTGPSNQRVGLRFTDIAIPQGSTVVRAYIQFEADEVQSDSTHLLVQGQASDDAATFTLDPYSVTSRLRTIASAAWSPPPWLVVGEQGVDQRTTDLSAIVQEVLDRPGWASGNAMGFVITGTGHRTARSYEGLPAGAAMLHIEAISALTGVGDPPSPALALRGVTPNPSRGAMRVELSLTDGRPASLELVDLAGRRVASRQLGPLGAGVHSVELRETLPTGVYFVRLAQGGRTRIAKAVVLR